MAENLRPLQQLVTLRAEQLRQAIEKVKEEIKTAADGLSPSLPPEMLDLLGERCRAFFTFLNRARGQVTELDHAGHYLLSRVQHQLFIRSQQTNSGGTSRAPDPHPLS